MAGKIAGTGAFPAGKPEMMTAGTARILSRVNLLTYLPPHVILPGVLIRGLRRRGESPGVSKNDGDSFF